MGTRAVDAKTPGGPPGRWCAVGGVPGVDGFGGRRGRGHVYLWAVSLAPVGWASNQALKPARLDWAVGDGATGGGGGGRGGVRARRRAERERWGKAGDRRSRDRRRRGLRDGGGVGGRRGRDGRRRGPEGRRNGLGSVWRPVGRGRVGRSGGGRARRRGRGGGLTQRWAGCMLRGVRFNFLSPAMRWPASCYVVVGTPVAWCPTRAVEAKTVKARKQNPGTGAHHALAHRLPADLHHPVHERSGRGSWPLTEDWQRRSSLQCPR